jgi:hypothetical protein
MMEMLSYRVDEVRNNYSHGVFLMIVWEYLKPIGNFERTIRRVFKYGIWIILRNIDLKHPFWECYKTL